MLRRIILGLAVFTLLLACGCSATPTPSSAGVAIYLTAGGLNGAQMQASGLDQIRLQDQPVIAPEDILSYDGQTHEMVLSEAALQRLTALKVPMNGLGFVVTVGGQPVYAGAFWSYLSSLMYEGVTIMVPLGPDFNSVKIGGPYPGGELAANGDPRGNARVMDALRQAGVLKE